MAATHGLADRLAPALSEGPCDRIEKAQARTEQPSQCKCTSRWHYVYCYDGYDPVGPRRFDASAVLAACPAPYCSQYADPLRKAPNKTEEVPTTTNVAPTTQAETTAEEVETTTEKPPLDLSTLVDADSVMVMTNDHFKCCEYSDGGKDAIVQDLTVPELPNVRKVCMRKTGCGCMFGNKWHSYTNGKGTGRCRLPLGDLARAMSWEPEAIMKVIEDADEPPDWDDD